MLTFWRLHFKFWTNPSSLQCSRIYTYSQNILRNFFLPSIKILFIILNNTRIEFNWAEVDPAFIRTLGQESIPKIEICVLSSRSIDLRKEAVNKGLKLFKISDKSFSILFVWEGCISMVYSVVSLGGLFSQKFLRILWNLFFNFDWKPTHWLFDPKQRVFLWLNVSCDTENSQKYLSMKKLPPTLHLFISLLLSISSTKFFNFSWKSQKQQFVTVKLPLQFEKVKELSLLKLYSNTYPASEIVFLLDRKVSKSWEIFWGATAVRKSDVFFVFVVFSVRITDCIT